MGSRFAKGQSAALIAGVWTVLGLLFALQNRVDAAYAGRSLNWTQAFILSLAGWYGWALLSPLIVKHTRQVGVGWQGIVSHVIVGLLLTLLKISATNIILDRAGFHWKQTFYIINIPVNLLTYAAIVFATHAVDVYRRAREERLMLAEARLELLKSQLHPHFLFNALHSIAELMHQDVEAADRALMRISDLLRASIDVNGRQEIRLADELALVERYLDIERLRLGDRLRAKVEVDPHALDALVPVFLLQPIVENAVRHAIAPRQAGGSVTLCAKRKDGELEIGIDDDGPGFAGGVTERIGLANTRARLAQLYGTGQRLRIGNAAGGGASIRIVLPFRT